MQVLIHVSRSATGEARVRGALPSVSLLRRPGDVCAGVALRGAHRPLPARRDAPQVHRHPLQSHQHELGEDAALLPAELWAAHLGEHGSG